MHCSDSFNCNHVYSTHVHGELAGILEIVYAESEKKSAVKISAPTEILYQFMKMRLRREMRDARNLIARVKDNVV